MCQNELKNSKYYINIHKNWNKNQIEHGLPIMILSYFLGKTSPLVKLLYGIYKRELMSILRTPAPTYAVLIRMFYFRNWDLYT